MDYKVPIEATSSDWANPINKQYYAIEFLQDLLTDWIPIRTNGKLGVKNCTYKCAELHLSPLSKPK